MRRVAVSNRSFAIPPTAALVLASAFWGLGTVISKGALASVAPITFLIIQLAPSVLVLWTAVFMTRSASPPRRATLAIVLLGCLNPGLSYTLSVLGLRLTSASVASFLWAAEPVLIVVMAWLLIGERPGIRLLAAIAAAAFGVLLVSGLASGVEDAGARSGDVLVLAGVACCAVYSVFSRRLVAADVDPLFIVALQQTAGLVWAAAIWPLQLAFYGAAPPITSLSIEDWTGATVSGLMYYAAAFWLYLIGLRSLPASVAGGFLNLIPLFAVAAAYFVLEERLDPAQWVGSAIILVSVLGLLSWSAPSRPASL
jgi:drug/metabolite transporter (DMT)-like permease